MAESMEVARITIVRVLDDDGDLVDYCTAVDNDGGLVPLTEILGILRMAEDTFIRCAMGEDHNPDEE